MESTPANDTTNPESRQDSTTSPPKDSSQRSLLIPQFTINNPLERSLETPEYLQNLERSYDIPQSHNLSNLQNSPPASISTRSDDDIRSKEILTEAQRFHPTPQRTGEMSTPNTEMFEEIPVRTRSRQGDDDRFEQKELPKTINNVFGSIEDFLNFFIKRSPEIRDFAKQYKEIEDTNDLEKLNSIICPLIILSINKEAQKDPTSTPEGNPAALFQMTFSSFEQFYGQILRAYTMNTFLYRNLNKYLRHEDWSSFNDLLSYAFGLCKAFFCKQLAKNEIPTPTNLLLYRGAAFDKEILEIYNPETLKNFSWYSVTSTTTSLTIAKGFMGGKSNSNDPKVPVLFIIEVPLMNPTAENKYLSHLDLKPYSEYKLENEVILPPGSVFTLQRVEGHPDDFIILKLRLISDVGALSHEGLIMPGAMQSKMMTETETKIMCMDGNDLFEALRHLTGNNLIQEIEFCLCKFNVDTMKCLTDILPTMNEIKRLKFISCSFAGNSLQFSTLNKIKKIEIVELDQIFSQILFAKKELWSHLTSLDFAFVNIQKVTSKDIKTLCIDCLQNLPQLESLSLDFHRCFQFTDQDMTDLCCLGLQNLTKLQSLSLNFKSCKALTDLSLVSLSTQGLQPLLTSLTLTFDFCDLMTDHGICSLSSHKLPKLTLFSLSICHTSKISDQSLANLTAQYPLLTSLALDFSHCSQISQRSLESLPTSLVSFKLCLAGFSQLTDSSIMCISTSLLPLTHLTSFEISFSMCTQLTNQSISHLSSQFLQNLSDLTSFKLDLGGCRLMTDQALKDLASYGLESLTKLTSLSLNFESCDLTNEGLHTLSLTALPSMPRLQTLDINLYWCSFINDEGLIALFTKGLPNLKSLTSLNLNISLLFKLSDQGIKVLCSQGLCQLTHLQHLSIDFSRCERITDQGLQYLATEGLKFLKNLTNLTLDLTKCPEITQEGVDTLQTQISQHLLKLTSTTIYFQAGSNEFDQHLLMIGNVGKSADPEMSLNILCERNRPVVAIPAKSQLQHELQESLFKIAVENQVPLSYPNDPKFSCLSSLNISFIDYPRASAQNILTLASKGLKYLTHLTSLHLDFTRLQVLTDQIFSEFCSEGLHPLQELTSLTLDLQECLKLTDQVMLIICSQLFEHFPKITFLSLQLGWCEQMTDHAIEILCSQGFQQLPFLKSLHLGFHRCKKITDQGLKILAASIPAQLASLAFYFDECREISDVGFRYLVENRTQLEMLHLRFPETKITDEGLMILASEGLAKMNKLKELELNFGSCQGISDQGVRKLCGEGLRKLKGLEKLSVDFEGCDLVTDVGVNDFCSLGLRNLRILREIKLYFEHCDHISDFTRMHIKKVLQYFGFKITNL